VEINPFTLTSEDRFSTFAMDVDTASYSAARNYLMSGSLPPADTVRVEEFVNYFRYGYPNQQQDAFTIVVDGAPSPFSAGTQMVRVGIQGQRVEASQRDPAMLTFVIDVSGSMDEPNRLPLVKRALTTLVDELNEDDQVAIVVYSSNTRVVLEHTSAAQRDRIVNAITSLSIEGSTNVEAGLRLGYQLASDNFKNDAINRVILCSDGVANVGATGPDAIRASIRDYASQGVLLTTVGFGMGSFNDYLMEQLANDGNGNYAYVDNQAEAERIFVQNLTGTLQVIAQDAKIQVDFNPNVVSQYRLLGYENRDVADEDFRNDEVDAGEVGAGHSVTALYEVRLTEQASGNAMTVQVRYEEPESGEIFEIRTPFDSSAIAADFTEAPPNFQLAVAVAGFAENLRGSGYAQDRPLNQVLEIAERVEPQFANDTDVQEFVQLIRQARTITGR
jgi:Ca-activated chloride channel family protein